MPPIHDRSTAGTRGGPPAHDVDEPPALTIAYAKVGLWLFVIYLALYAAFVGVNAFAPDVMAKRPTGGLNLAVSTGLGLIVAAIILSLVYMAICKRVADRHWAASGTRPGGDGDQERGAGR
ncbi:DUF485 domain-containing protein [Tautonia marina]|uniref:DUF485 domain-containing protein n=1 Tax=Tautonia marina TaxID=2653855 RepID=UPI001F1F7D43|nr:DUF485 domain-containing protein [Tautonia marina]